MTDAEFMKLALKQAEAAAEAGEIPVGAVMVKNGEVIAAGRNDREAKNDPLGHAEIRAIEAAAQRLGDWRLGGCTLYVTLEPCAMCAGAIINSRIDRVVYAAKDAAAGCFGSVINMAHIGGLYSPAVASGVCEAEAEALLAAFFEKLRKKG